MPAIQEGVEELQINAHEERPLSLSEFWARAWHLFSISLGYEIWVVWDRPRGWT